MPWALGFFTYSSIKEHPTSIVSLEGNKSYNSQSLQLKINGFWIWGGLAIANPSKISLSQLWTMSTFHMARALLTETMFFVDGCLESKLQHCGPCKKNSKKIKKTPDLDCSSHFEDDIMQNH
jgi:hypothetical protein